MEHVPGVEISAYMVRGNISMSEEDIARQKHGLIAGYSDQDADSD